MRNDLLTVISLGKIECPMLELLRGGDQSSARFLNNSAIGTVPIGPKPVDPDATDSDELE